MTSSPMIAVTGLGHTFERWGHRIRALDKVSLTVPAGEWVMLVGHNGSGKSTLLKILAGELTVQEGDVRVAGDAIDHNGGRAIWERVFLVHQDPTAGTAPALTVGEHLRLAAVDEPGGARDKPTRRARYMDLLGSFSLDVSLGQPVHTLSGGQRQLLCLLMAKLRPAGLILLDEPFAALDPERSLQCERALEALHAGGKTIVMVTHDLEFACTHGDRTIGLSQGLVGLDESGAARSSCTALSARLGRV